MVTGLDQPDPLKLNTLRWSSEVAMQNEVEAHETVPSPIEGAPAMGAHPVPS
jgi:hypothetical protein